MGTGGDSSSSSESVRPNSAKMSRLTISPTLVTERWCDVSGNFRNPVGVTWFVTGLGRGAIMLGLVAFLSQAAAAAATVGSIVAEVVATVVLAVADIVRKTRRGLQ